MNSGDESSRADKVNYLARAYWDLHDLWLEIGAVAKDQCRKDTTSNGSFWEGLAHRASLRAGRYARLADQANKTDRPAIKVVK